MSLIQNFLFLLFLSTTFISFSNAAAETPPIAGGDFDFAKENHDKTLIYEYPAPKGQSIEELHKCILSSKGIDPTQDNTLFIKGNGYAPEDLAEWFLHEQVMLSKRKTSNPYEADIFIVNIAPVMSEMAGVCNGMNHEDRAFAWRDILMNSPFFNNIGQEKINKKQQQHAFICQSWRCESLVHDSLKPLVKQMTYMIHEKNQEWIGIDDFPMDNVLVIPYVANSAITPFTMSSPNLKYQSPRKHMVTFLGSLSRRSGYRVPLKDIERVYINSGGLDTFRYQNQHEKDKFDLYGEVMMNSDFCLVIGGDTPSSRRLFDSILSGCIPVFIGLNYRKPFGGEDTLPYFKFSLVFNIHKWANYDEGYYGGDEDYPQLAIDSLYEIPEKHKRELRLVMAHYVKYLDWRRGDFVLEAIVNELVKMRNSDSGNVS